MAVQMKPSAVQQYLADYAREIDTAREPIGIVLLNLGGPTTLDDVEPCTVSNLLALGADPFNYNASVVYLTVRYRLAP